MKTYKELKKNLSEADGNLDGDSVEPLAITQNKASRPANDSQSLSYKYELEKKMMGSFSVFTRLFVDWLQNAYISKEIDVNNREYAEYKIHNLLSVMIGSAVNKAENLRNVLTLHGIKDVKKWDSKREILKSFTKLEKPLQDFVLTYMEKVEEMKKISERNAKKAEKPVEEKRNLRSNAEIRY